MYVTALVIVWSIQTICMIASRFISLWFVYSCGYTLHCQLMDTCFKLFSRLLLIHFNSDSDRSFTLTVSLVCDMLLSLSACEALALASLSASYDTMSKILDTWKVTYSPNCFLFQSTGAYVPNFHFSCW